MAKFLSFAWLAPSNKHAFVESRVFSDFIDQGEVKADDDYIATDENKRKLEECIKIYKNKPLPF